MNAFETHKSFPARHLAALLAVMLVPAGIANAQTPPKKPSTPAKAAAPAKGASSAAKGASRGPTTAGRGTTASRGPTTAGRGTTASRGPTTAGRGATTASRGPAAGSRGGVAGNRGAAAGGRGGATHTALGGRTPRGNTVRRSANGSEVRMRANGRPGDVHDARRGMDIHNGLNGNRRVSVERADHSRIVAERGGRGYVQHPYSITGANTGIALTTSTAAPMTDTIARYHYHGVYRRRLHSRGSIIAPAFYGWAYNPWVRAGALRVGMRAAIPGMDIMVATSLRIRCIRAHRCG